MLQLLDNATLFDGAAVSLRRSVLIDGTTIAEISTAGATTPPGAVRFDLEGRRLVPGFVDIQVNGGGGALFNNDPSVSALHRIADAHVQFGTTSLLPTLISDDYSVMRAAIAAVRQAIDEAVPGIIGIHLEGPFLSETRKGAHDASKFRKLDAEGLEILTSLGDDAVALVTLAPENTPPAHIAELREAGVIVFAGHTAATYEQCVEAEAAGLHGYTHLFNAMTPFGSRDPGVVGRAIESSSTVFSIIADGHHVHPASVRMAVRSKCRGGAILVTDAMPTVGVAKPWFELDGERIEVQDGVLRNAAGSLAGSHLTMIDAVRNAVDFSDITWDEAVRMATTYPSAAVGLRKHVGEIRVGGVADLVEMNDEIGIVRVWRRGVLMHNTVSRWT